MRILVDDNISYRVCALFNKSEDVCKNVSDFHLDKNTDDASIWQFAKNNSFIILTKDNDFEAMSRLFGCPPKVIQLLSGNTKTVDLLILLEKKLPSIEQFESDNENCLVYLQ